MPLGDCRVIRCVYVGRVIISIDMRDRGLSLRTRDSEMQKLHDMEAELN
jgi:hypothetical protein